MAHNIKSIIIIFAVCLIIRILVAIPAFRNRIISVTADSPRYERLALNLIYHNKFNAEPVMLPGLPENHHLLAQLPGGTQPEVYRTPGYPAFIGILYYFFGYHSIIVIIGQIILSCIISVLIFLITKTISSKLPKWVPFSAGILYAINPRPGIHAAQITSETLFTFLLVAFLFFFLRFLIRRRLIDSLIAGLLAALVAYTRPVGLFIPLLALPALIILLIKNFRRAIGGCLVFLLTFSIAVSVWYMRNYKIYHRVYFSTLGDWNLAFYHGIHILRQSWNTPEKETTTRFLYLLMERYPELSSEWLRCIEWINLPGPRDAHIIMQNIDASSKAASLMQEIMLREWRITIPSFAGGAFWSLWAGISEWQGFLPEFDKRRFQDAVNLAKSSLYSMRFIKTGEVVLAQILFKVPLSVLIMFSYIWLLSIVLYAGALLGIVSLWRLNKGFIITLVLLILFALLSAGPTGNSRYFVTSHPLISLLSVFGIAKLKECKKRE